MQIRPPPPTGPVDGLDCLPGPPPAWPVLGERGAVGILGEQLSPPDPDPDRGQADSPQVQLQRGLDRLGDRWVARLELVADRERRTASEGGVDLGEDRVHLALQPEAVG